MLVGTGFAFLFFEIHFCFCVSNTVFPFVFLCFDLAGHVAGPGFDGRD
jgi:hypothetical protein